MQQDYILFDDIDKDGPQQRARVYDVPADELGRADGEVRFTADLTCARCVDPYPFANQSPFHLRFAPRPEGLTEETDEVELTSEDELDTEFYAERQIGLRELAAEQVQLTIPMKPLCDERCLGLCPQCGKNRNREG